MNMQKEKLPKKQLHSREAKSNRELEILFECLQKYLQDENRTQNKQKICMEYLNILHRENFNTYEYKTVSDFVNNHRKKPIPPQFLIQNRQNQNNALPLAPNQFVGTPQTQPPSSQPFSPQIPNNPNYIPQTLTSTPSLNNTTYNYPSTQPANQIYDQTNPPPLNNQQFIQQTLPSQHPLKTPEDQPYPMQPFTVMQGTNKQFPSQINNNPPPFQPIPPQPANNTVPPSQTPSDMTEVHVPSIENISPLPPFSTGSSDGPFFPSRTSSDNFFTIKYDLPSRTSSDIPWLPSRTSSDAFTHAQNLPQLNNSTQVQLNTTANSAEASTNGTEASANSTEANAGEEAKMKSHENETEVDEEADNEDDDDDQHQYESKKGGKSCSKTNVTGAGDNDSDSSFSSRSPSPSSLSIPFNSSADTCQMKLPNVPKAEGEVNEAVLDDLKIALYDYIKQCYRFIHDTSYPYKTEEEKEANKKVDVIKENEEKIRFQQELEKRFVEATSRLSDLIKSPQVCSHDSICETIDLMSNQRPFSAYTYSLNDKIVSADNSSVPSRSSSEDKSQTQFMETSSSKFTKSENEKESVTVKSYAKELYKAQDNEKLVSFSNGNYDKESYQIVDLTDSEASTIISYSIKDQENPENDLLVLEYAYANYHLNSHVLNLKNMKVETGFFYPVTTMHFHRYNGIDKLFLCGDYRVKEFTIQGLVNNDLQISNTNTYYFGNQEYKTAAITVWDKELVLGCGSKIYFWNIDDNPNSRNKDTLESKVDIEMLENSGLDMSKVDWKHGKSYKTNALITLKDTMAQISSIEIIGNNNDETYLAVSSYLYPAIYIYNKQHVNVSRLVSHTMGVTCLKGFNYNLFSGSFDFIVRLWNTNIGVPSLLCDTNAQRITAIESAFYCDSLFLFIGGENNKINCVDLNKKKHLFEINLKNNLVPRKIVFLTGNDQKIGQHAKLMVISEFSAPNTLNNRKNFSVQFFEFK